MYLGMKKLFIPISYVNSAGPDSALSADDLRLRKLLSEAFRTMDEHYYLPVSPEIYEKFVQDFPAERLKTLNEKNKKTPDFVHLGAGLLVDRLKSPRDKFTNFVPPEKEKEFKEKAYAVTEDLGLEGKLDKSSFLITHVQKHAEAFEKGVRPGDRLLKIDGRALDADEAEIRKKLSGPVGTTTRLLFLLSSTGRQKEIILESKSYFKETVEALSTDVPGVLALKITHFNQKTSEDFSEEMVLVGTGRIRHLIIDLRDNGGGPPLAAREILGFFLPPNDPLFAIARKKKRPVMLTAPSQPVSYHGPITMLVNHKTGSAAEMFSGILQSKKLADLVGEKTAGATYLKSIYDLGDGSLIFMITSLTYFYDHRVYPADGLTPDTLLPSGGDSLRFTLDKIR